SNTSLQLNLLPSLISSSPSWPSSDRKTRTFLKGTERGGQSVFIEQQNLKCEWGMKRKRTHGHR
ncbi:Hypothetical predicted protein, partial [Olea europaea subsp. europaea]